MQRDAQAALNIAALRELDEFLARQSVRDAGCRARLKEQRAESLRQLEAGFVETDALFASNAEFLNCASAWISEQIAKAESPPTTASEALNEKARIEVIVQADGSIRMNSYLMGRQTASWFPMDMNQFLVNSLPMALLEAGIRRPVDAPEQDTDRAALNDLRASIRSGIAEQRRALEASAVVSEQQKLLLEKSQQLLQELVGPRGAGPASEGEQ